MSKQPQNHGQQWSAPDDRRLAQLADQNTPTGLIGWQLGRTEAAVRSHASDLGISLAPTNRSPYGKGR
ncbi:hypothetical protein GA0111570_10277 [Raineyella antarctica]|uniref:Uncharacterized protein n=1 Tax=Raineyella antarctica TaxID=1577474 RepID=A0A1G6GE64_9ACTN|nr:hypothetical protein [Raineyella antarctica]SDB80291.1 hypothetical protein GA0111570_10277 [Raineyella antarctica]